MNKDYEFCKNKFVLLLLLFILKSNAYIFK